MPTEYIFTGGIEGTGREVHHSPPSRVQITNEWSYNSSTAHDFIAREEQLYLYQRFKFSSKPSSDFQSLEELAVLHPAFASKLCSHRVLGLPYHFAQRLFLSTWRFHFF